jgi:hypothetical protein
LIVFSKADADGNLGVVEVLSVIVDVFFLADWLQAAANMLPAIASTKVGFLNVFRIIFL